MCVCVHESEGFYNECNEYTASGDQEMVLDAQELGLQVVASHQMWVLVHFHVLEEECIHLTAKLSLQSWCANWLYVNLTQTRAIS